MRPWMRSDCNSPNDPGFVFDLTGLWLGPDCGCGEVNDVGRPLFGGGADGNSPAGAGYGETLTHVPFAPTQVGLRSVRPPVFRSISCVGAFHNENANGVMDAVR